MCCDADAGSVLLVKYVPTYHNRTGYTDVDTGTPSIRTAEETAPQVAGKTGEVLADQPKRAKALPATSEISNIGSLVRRICYPTVATRLQAFMYHLGAHQ